MHRLITEEIPRKVAEDEAYRNARKNNDAANAPGRTRPRPRSRHARARSDDTELFKQFSDNESFKRWLSDAVFRTTFGDAA